ncbi:hypothetical protein AUC43_07770 [Hymenobacter sedentarius]|uniref:Uncharacterized protein n=1 Tax=Hymenobacter sedentarius TaxID=1411621 RepID=A0A0U3SFS6_9BACT|nr:hypothetical protein AUC43_07770 [Hymenobacter sedentarius]
MLTKEASSHGSTIRATVIRSFALLRMTDQASEVIRCTQHDNFQTHAETISTTAVETEFFRANGRLAKQLPKGLLLNPFIFSLFSLHDVNSYSFGFS